jgi:hypothetical protein
LFDFSIVILLQDLIESSAFLSLWPDLEPLDRDEHRNLILIASIIAVEFMDKFTFF